MPEHKVTRGWHSAKWLVLRVAITLVSAVSGPYLVGADADLPDQEHLIFYALGFVGMFLGLLVVLAMLAVNPRSRGRWRRPSWFENPATARQPLQFFHAVGVCLFAIGVGGGIGMLVENESRYVTNLLFPLSMAAAVRLVVIVAPYLFPHCLEEQGQAR